MHVSVSGFRGFAGVAIVACFCCSSRTLQCVCVWVCEGVPVCVAYTLCISNVCSVYCLIYQAWIIYVCRYVQTEQPVPLENQLGFSSQNRIYNPACCHVATINGECQHECDLLQHTHSPRLFSSIRFNSSRCNWIELPSAAGAKCFNFDLLALINLHMEISERTKTNVANEQPQVESINLQLDNCSQLKQKPNEQQSETERGRASKTCKLKEQKSEKLPQELPSAIDCVDTMHVWAGRIQKNSTTQCHVAHTHTWLVFAWQS